MCPLPVVTHHWAYRWDRCGKVWAAAAAWLPLGTTLPRQSRPWCLQHITGQIKSKSERSSRDQMFVKRRAREGNTMQAHGIQIMLLLGQGACADAWV